MFFERTWLYGDLEMIKWLHKKNIEGCTTDVMDRPLCKHMLGNDRKI